MDCPSTTPLVGKLGVKAGCRLALLEAPEGFPALLGPLPAEVEIHTEIGPAEAAGLDVIVLFVREKSELQQRFPALARRLTSAGGLWVCWPKKASRVATDLTDHAVRAVGLDGGLVDNKVCAIDAIWSGLRFVIRVADRKKR